VELAGVATLKVRKSGSLGWESIPDEGNGRNVPIVADRGSYLGSAVKNTTKPSSTHGRTASVQ